MLKHSDNTISRRQEVGRGLRLCVNQHGDRMDNPAMAHDVNILTVVASESYKEFVGNLQREISESISARPRKADEAFFTGKVITTETKTVVITADQAKDIVFYLIQNSYVDKYRQIIDKYHEAKTSGALAALPPGLAPHAEQIFGLIDSVFSEFQLPEMGDDRKPKINPLNANYEKKEFKALWGRINRKAVYRVEFDSKELIRNCIRVLDKELQVTPLTTYTVQKGEQTLEAIFDQLKYRDTLKKIGKYLWRSRMGTLAADTHALAENVEFTDDEMVVSLVDGRKIIIPLVWFPRLANATKSQLENFELLGDGESIRWPEVDEDLSGADLLLGNH